MGCCLWLRKKNILARYLVQAPLMWWEFEILQRGNLKKYLFYTVYMNAFCLYVYGYTMFVQYPQMPEEGLGSLGTGVVVVSCCVGAGSQTWILWCYRRRHLFIPAARQT